MVIWNKQSSHLASDRAGFSVIQRAVLKYDPNLVVLSEANISDANLKNVNSKLEDYDFHYKVIPQTKYARIALLVKKNTTHLKRLTELEHPDLACMWFKMRLGAQTVILATWYRP